MALGNGLFIKVKVEEVKKEEGEDEDSKFQ